MYENKEANESGVDLIKIPTGSILTNSTIDLGGGVPEFLPTCEERKWYFQLFSLHTTCTLTDAIPKGLCLTLPKIAVKNGIIEGITVIMKNLMILAGV